MLPVIVEDDAERCGDTTDGKNCAVKMHRTKARNGEYSFCGAGVRHSSNGSSYCTLYHMMRGQVLLVACPGAPPPPPRGSSLYRVEVNITVPSKI